MKVETLSFIENHVPLPASGTNGSGEESIIWC